MGQPNSVGLGDQPEQTAIGREAPGPARSDNFQGGFAAKGARTKANRLQAAPFGLAAPKPIILKSPLIEIIDGDTVTIKAGSHEYRIRLHGIDCPESDQPFGDQAAETLARASEPVIMAGSLIYWSAAQDALRELAERLQAPVYLNAMGRGSLPQDYPLFFSRTRRGALARADAILIIGTPLDFRLAYGRRFNPQAKTIQVDIDPTELGRNRDIDVCIQGDASAVLGQLLAELGDGRPDHSAWLKTLREEEKKTTAAREEFLNSDSVPIHPLRLCKEMAAFVDENTTVIGDGGDIVNLSAQVLPINHPGQWYDPGPMGTLGVGTGFAMAVKSAFPGRKILMVNGDGTFGLNGFDFDTFVRFDMPVVSVVGNDRQWGQIIVGQRQMYGPDRLVASLLGDNARYDRVVEALGGHGEFVERPQDIRPAIERAFASGKPACVNVITDPEPPGIRGGYQFM